MPLIRNGTGNAISTNKFHYLIFKNIQVDTYTGMGILYSRSDYIIVDNFYAEGCDRGVHTIDSGSHNCRMLNGYTSNCKNGGFLIQNKNGLIDNCWTTTTKIVGQDYYISVIGGVNGTNNCLRKSTVKRYEPDSHAGHGFSFKAGSKAENPTYKLVYSLMEDLEIYDSKFELRNLECKNNVARNINIYGQEGVMLRDECSYNTIENVYVTNSVKNGYFNQYRRTDEYGDNSPHHNTFINCRADNLTEIVATGELYEELGNIVNNTYINCSFDNITRIYQNNINRTINFESSNVFKNCILSNMTETDNRGGMLATFESSDFWNNGFAVPSGATNIEINPLYSPFPIATDEGLNVGAIISGNNYDAYNNQRFEPITLGVSEITDTILSKVHITWTNSISPDVTETVIYRNELEIGRVLVADPSEFTDTNPVSGQTYKYEVQAVSPTGESTDENTGVGGNVVNLPIP